MIRQRDRRACFLCKFHAKLGTHMLRSCRKSAKRYEWDLSESVFPMYVHAT